MSPRKPTAEGSPRATRRWRPAWVRTLLLAAAGVAGLAVAVASVQGIRVLDRLGEVERVDVPVQRQGEPYFADHPRNVLVLGSDTREGLSEEEQLQHGTPEDVEGQRSDTIILVHLDPRRERAVVVHFPRDLRVRIPGHGMDRINEAFELGGPSLAVRTVRRFTGLPIHNYVEVDFVGFQNIVEAMGGVNICVDRPMFDELAGLELPEAGCYTLDGEEALAFVRARHVEGDLIPDFARIGRQQQFLRAVLNRLLSVRSLLDADLIQTAAAQVTTDDTLDGADFVYLGTELRKLSETDPSGASTVDFRVVPSKPRGAIVVALESRTERLFEALRTGEPLGEVGAVAVGTLPSPAQITVQALDAGAPDAAAETEARLRRAGFIVLPTEEAPRPRKRSRILYRPDAQDRAEVVSGYFPGIPVREADEELLGDAEVVVVVADDGLEMAG